MNLITKAISDVQYRIPREILRMAYLESNLYNTVSGYQRRNISLDQAIREMTIVPRVLVDANIVGGQTVDVNLEGIPGTPIDESNTVYEVPIDRTNNRTIISCLSVTFFRSSLLPGNNYGSIPSILPNNANEINSSGMRAMDSRSGIPMISSSECRVIGHNTIMVSNRIRTATVVRARCVLENEEELNNLHIRAALDFSKLCEYAVKSYVYNELIVKLDRGRIERGQEIGSIKSIIDNYADAEENYQTFLKEQWAGVAIHSDRATYEALLRIQIDPGI